MIHTQITPAEQADRVAIRELVDAYAHCAQRRDAEGQKSLFTEDTHRDTAAAVLDGIPNERLR
jgi:SnoaL-like domain